MIKYVWNKAYEIIPNPTLSVFDGKGKIKCKVSEKQISKAGVHIFYKNPRATLTF
jgi:hypothetical protein